MLQETKEVLEDQLEDCRARTDKIHLLEKHSLLLKARIHDMEQVRQKDNTKCTLKLQEKETLKYQYIIYIYDFKLYGHVVHTLCGLSSCTYDASL